MRLRFSFQQVPIYLPKAMVSIMSESTLLYIMYLLDTTEDQIRPLFALVSNSIGKHRICDQLNFEVVSEEPG